jgi:DNA processing protein
MGEAAPARIWIRGEPQRIDLPQVAVVGSRTTSAALQAATRRIARALSDDGWVIASGLARGADAAAHAGGARGQSGTLAIPACGLERMNAAFLREEWGHATFLAIAPPDQAFNAGIAIRRNAVVAALSDVVILVATGARGGSWYAVREALRRGTPVVCVEDGVRTPEGNAWLLRSGGAVALSAHASGKEACRIIRRAQVEGGRAERDPIGLELLKLFD